MNPILKEAKQTIRKFIQMHWSDQKLAEVYAFNADGKMEYSHYCNCIRGVTLANKLHTSDEWYMKGGTCRAEHYVYTGTLPLAKETELCYRAIGFVDGKVRYYWYSSREVEDKIRQEHNELRQRRLSPILRAEMRRRERLNAQYMSMESEVAQAKLEYENAR